MDYIDKSYLRYGIRVNEDKEVDIKNATNIFALEVSAAVAQCRYCSAIKTLESARETVKSLFGPHKE
jgi:hypothetical protein